MANITLLPSAKVPLIYPDTNTMSTEWYRFFLVVYGFTGGGILPVSKGGTGLGTIGNHQVIIGNASNVFEPAVFTGSGIAITYAPGVINLAIGSSGVTPGTYGSASTVGVFTVNAYGALTAASNTSIGIDASQIISGTLPVIRGGTGQSTYTDGQLLIGNSTGNTLTKATLTAGAGVSVTNGAGSIILANTGVLSVSGTAPVVSSGGTTPAISMAAANTTTNGYLTSTDWNTFNNKAPATSGTSILYGNGSGGFSNVTIGSGVSFVGGTLSATGSGGTVTSVTGTAPIASSGGTTPAISISQANTTTDGYLSSTDWNTFNSKQPAGTYVNSVSATTPITSTGGVTPTIAIPVATSSADGYLSSTDWSTFNNKQPAGTYVTSISISSSNGFTGTSSGGATPSLTLATSVTGILKGNGTAISAATSGTDYAPATSGSSILYGNGAGGFSNVTIGSGLSFVSGTLSALGGGGGTVTSVTGTAPISVATGTTTPVISISLANTSTDGYLSSTDWNTFNNKQAALVSGTNLKTVSGTSLLGSGDLGIIGEAYGGTGTNTGYYSFKNKLINGNFLVWQRGTSVTPALGSLTQYVSDRWACYQAGAATTIAQAAGFGGFQYCAAWNGVASNSEVTMFQCIESVNSYPLYASYATFTVWAYASVAKTVTLIIDYANAPNNFSSVTVIQSQAFSHSGSGWEKLVLTTSSVLPAGAQNGIRVRANFPTCTTGLFGITGCQLEQGQNSTAFDTRDYGSELLKCQRYYSRINCNAYSCIANGILYATTLFLGPYQYTVPMLYAPTLTYSNLNDFAIIYPGGGSAPTSITFDTATAWCARWNIGGSGWVAGAGYLQGQNSNAWLAMSAEL